MKRSSTVNPSETSKTAPRIRLQRNSIVADVDRLENILQRNTRDVAVDLPPTFSGGGRKTYPLSRSVVGMFCFIASISLILNAFLLSTGTVYGHFLSYGLAGLYVLVGVCVIASLALSHKQFRHEREVAQTRVNDLSSQFVDLLKERREWIAKIKASQTAVSLMEQSLEQAEARLGLRKVELASAIALSKDEEDRLEGIKLNYSLTESALNESGLRLETLVVELAAVEGSVDESRNASNQLGLQLERLESDVHAAEGALATLKSDVVAEEGVLSDFRVSIDEASERLQILIEELQEAELKRDIAIESLQNAETQLSALTVKSRDAEAELLTLKESLVTAADEKASWLNILDEFESRQTSLLGATDDLSHELEHLHKQKLDIGIEVGKLRNYLDSLQEQNVAQVNQSVTLEAEASRLHQLIAQREASLLALDELAETKEVQLQAVCVEETETEKRVSALLSEVGELERLVAMKSAAESESEELFVEIAKRTSIVAELGIDRQKLANELEVIQSQKQAFSGELDTLQANRFEAEQTKSELQSNLDSLHCQLLELLKERDSLLNSLKILKDSIQGQSSCLFELEAREAASIKIAEDAEKAAADASRRVEMLNEKAGAYAEQVQAKSVEMFECKQALMAIRAEVRELESTKAKLVDVEVAYGELNECLTERLLEEKVAVQRLAEAEKQVQLRYAEIATLEEQSEALSRRVNGALDKLEERNRDCELMSDRGRELAQQLRVLEESIQDSSSQLDRCKSLKSGIEVEVELGRLELESISIERLGRLEEMDTLSKEISTLQTRLSNLALEAEKLEEARIFRLELEHEAEDFALQLKNLHEQRKAVEQDIESRNLELSTANALLVQLSQNREDYEKQSLESAFRLRQLSEEVIDAQGISQQWSTYLNALSEDVQAQEANRAKLVLTIDQLLHHELEVRASIDQAETVRKTMQQDELALEDKIKRSTFQLETVQNQLKDAVANIDETQLMAQHASRDLEQLLKQVANAELEFEAMQQRSTTELNRSEECKDVVRQLELQINSLRCEYEKGREQVDGLSLKSEGLRQGILETEQIIQAKQQEIIELSASAEEHGKLQRECEVQQQTLIGILAETENQFSKLRELEKEVSKLKIQKDELVKIDEAFCLKEAELDKVLDETSLRRSELDLLVQEISILEIEKGELIRLQALNEEQAGRLLLTSEQIDAKRVQLDHVETLVQAMNEESEHLQSEINRHRLQAEEVATLIGLQDNELEEKSEQVLVVRRLVEEHEATRRAIEKRIADLAKRGHDLEESVLLFEIQLQERSDEKIKVDAVIEKLSGTLEKLRDEYAELAESARGIEGLLAAKTKELEEVENDVSFSLGRVSQLVQATVSLTSARKVAGQELDEKETLLELANAEVQRLSQVADTLRGECEVLAPQLGEMRSEIDSLDLKKADLEEEIIRLTEQTVVDLVAPAAEVNSVVRSPVIEEQIWDTVVELSRINDKSRKDELEKKATESAITIADETVVNYSEVLAPVRVNQRDEWDFVLQ